MTMPALNTPQMKCLVTETLTQATEYLRDFSESISVNRAWRSKRHISELSTAGVWVEFCDSQHQNSKEQSCDLLKVPLGSAFMFASDTLYDFSAAFKNMAMRMN